MCGRYANHVEKLRGWTDILGDWPAEFWTGFNVAPTQQAPVVTIDGVEVMRWGIIPSWAKDESAGKYATFNARIESVKSKPSFRGAWKQSQTCLVPALGYYEWKTIADVKQPYFIRSMRQDELLVFAGLWDRWNDEGSFTVITQPASGDLADLHDRMPVFLNHEQAGNWLSAADERLFEDQSMVEGMEYFPVNRRVNNVRNEGPELLLKDELPPTQAGFDF